MGEAEFGNISSHADYLVQHMREHPSITDTVLQTLLSSSQRRGKMCEAMLPYSRYIKRYSLLCLQVCWQSHRLASFPDPARDHRGGQQHQEEEKAPISVNFMEDAVDLAPFGWVDALDGRRVNCFGDALSSAFPQGQCRKRKRPISRATCLWRGGEAPGLPCGIAGESRPSGDWAGLERCRQGGLCTSPTSGRENASV